MILFLNTILIPGWSRPQAKSIAEGWLLTRLYEQANTFESKISQISYFLDLVGKESNTMTVVAINGSI